MKEDHIFFLSPFTDQTLDAVIIMTIIMIIIENIDIVAIYFPSPLKST